MKIEDLEKQIKKIEDDFINELITVLKKDPRNSYDYNSELKEYLRDVLNRGESITEGLVAALETYLGK